ncbi:MAG: DUF2085 domain-containing protein [Anaerolineales bacterium]
MGLNKRFWQSLLPVASLLVFFWWFQLTPAGLLGKMDGIGYAVCHRIEERSFHVDGRQMPLCARCTGTFGGAFIGLTVQVVVARRRSRLPSRSILAFLAFLAFLWAVDGANSYLYLLKEVGRGAISIPNLYTPNNTLRLFTGSGMGLAMALVLYPVLQQTLWRQVDSRPALSRRAIAILLGGVYLLDLAILTEHPLILYPIAIISPLGALSLLVIVFGMLWVMVMREENTFEHVRQLWLPLLAGLTLAFLLIGGIDLLRFHLTGTWGGYPLP